MEQLQQTDTLCRLLDKRCHDESRDWAPPVALSIRLYDLSGKRGIFFFFYVATYLALGLGVFSRVHQVHQSIITLILITVCGVSILGSRWFGNQSSAASCWFSAVCWCLQGVSYHGLADERGPVFGVVRTSFNLPGIRSMTRILANCSISQLYLLVSIYESGAWVRYGPRKKKDRSKINW